MTFLPEIPESIINYPLEYSSNCLNIIKAVERGYYFDFNSQEVVTPLGTRMKPKQYGTQRYPFLTMNDNTGRKKNVSFAIHKFVAYLLYGEIALRKGVNVRHLNANKLDLSKNNIAIGSSRDNNLDKPAADRCRISAHARKSQGLRPLNSVVKDEEVEIILRKYLKIKGDLNRAKQGAIDMIMEDHKYSRQCLQAICSGYSFPDIYNRVIKELND
jgi:hypothetical protein